MPGGRQVSLRRNATQGGVAAELVNLLETVTADGRITDDEVAALRTWLDDNRASDLASIEFLRATLDQILADGVVTPEERKAIHKAVERVLPREVRARSRGVREASALLEKTRLREEKAAVREERARNRSVGSFNFMVAGVTYQGRADLIDKYLIPEQAVFLLREPTNSYDRNAVEIRTVHNVQIGYVPREYAAEMAGMLDAGFRQIAYCTKILEGKRAPIPIVQLALYRPEATVAGAIAPSEIPKRLSPGEPLPTPRLRKGETKPTTGKAQAGKGCFGIVAMAFAAILFLFWLVLSR